MCEKCKEIAPYVIHTGANGKFSDDGELSTNKGTIQVMLSRISEHFDRMVKNNEPKRLLLYCHGGLVPKCKGINLTKHHYDTMKKNNIYPVYLIWESGLLQTLESMFKSIDSQFQNQSPSLKTLRGFIPPKLEENYNDFIVQQIKKISLHGKHAWDVWAEMKETGAKIFEDGGGGDIFLSEFLKRFKDDNIEIHIVGHSAGSIVLSTLLKRLNQKESKLQGLKIKSCTLMAAACTEELFNKEYVLAFKNGLIENFFFYTLSDELERDDICFVYTKSLLYAISEFLESSSKLEKIIGMERYAGENEFIRSLNDNKQRAAWIISQEDNQETYSEFIGGKEPIKLISKSKKHGDFDNDTSTMNSVIKSIVGCEDIEPYYPTKEFFKLAGIQSY